MNNTKNETMKKSPSSSVRFFFDLIFLSLLTIISLFFISFYFNAQYFDVGYPDWIVHAFRVQSLQENGFISWIHTWSNGISLWRSYQFVPHLLTLLLAMVTNLPIHHTMVLMTIILFVAIRIIIYLVLRSLHFTPLPAFACALLSFDIAQYWSGVADYTLLFAFTLTPLLLLSWIKFYQGKLQYLYPYISGLCFYIHPLLGFNAVSLWAFAAIFSNRKIFSKTLLTQVVIFLLTSSLFWFPIVSRLSYSYTNPFLSSKYFLDLVLAKYDYYGLSLALLAALLVSCLWMFKKLPAPFAWAKVLLIYAICYLGLIVIGSALDLSNMIYQFQYSRGSTILGIAIIFIFAVLAQKIANHKSILLKGIATFFLLLTVIEGAWFTSIYSPHPITTADDIVSLAFQKGIIKETTNRIVTPTIDWSSYLGPATVKFPYSYMEHLDSNQIAQRLSQLISYNPTLTTATEPTLQRLDDYYRVSGTKYLIFDEKSPLTKAYILKKDAGYKDLGQLNTMTHSFHMFSRTEAMHNAVLIDPAYKQDMQHFPFSLKFSNINDQIELDEYVHRFATTLYNKANTPLSVDYPTQDTITVNIPSGRKSNLVFINESHDVNWKAYFNGVEQTITPTGPNFMLITLADTTSGGQLQLRHSWSVYMYVGSSFIILLPIIFVLFRKKKQQHRRERGSRIR